MNDPQNSVSLFDMNRKNVYGEMFCVAPDILSFEVDRYWDSYLKSLDRVQVLKNEIVDKLVELFKHQPETSSGVIIGEIVATAHRRITNGKIRNLDERTDSSESCQQ